MDSRSVEFLAEALTDAIAKVRGNLPRSDATGRGTEAIRLCHALLDGAAAERDFALAALPGASVSALPPMGRKLLRIQYDIQNLYVELAPYVGDVGRQDLPLGLVAVIDNLVESMLTSGVDPLIHVDPTYNYMTVWLLARVKDLLDVLKVPYAPALEPIAFVVPSIEGENALLLPILAHEVGHVATEQHDLHTQFLADPVIVSDLTLILEECVQRDPSAIQAEWVVSLHRWIEELLCDTASNLLSGPSALLASAAFLPAPAQGGLTDHPFPGDRIRISLDQLSVLGWDEFLAEIPQVVDWLRAIGSASASRTYASPKEEFLRRGIEILVPHLVGLVTPTVTGVLTHDEFTPVAQSIDSLLAIGVPPAQFSDPAFSPSPWQLLLAGWLHAIKLHGGSPKAVAASVADTDFNRFMLKSIEMAHMARLWRSM